MIALSDIRSVLELPAEKDHEAIDARDDVVELWETVTDGLWLRRVDLVETIRRKAVSQYMVFTKLRPIESVSKVEVRDRGGDWEELAATDYEVLAVDGRIDRVIGCWGEIVRVTYTGGFTDDPQTGQAKTPQDIKRALLAQALFMQQRLEPSQIGVSSKAVEKSTTTYSRGDMHPLFEDASIRHRRLV